MLYARRKPDHFCSCAVPSSHAADWQRCRRTCSSPRKPRHISSTCGVTVKSMAIPGLWLELIEIRLPNRPGLSSTGVWWRGGSRGRRSSSYFLRPSSFERVINPLRGTWGTLRLEHANPMRWGPTGQALNGEHDFSQWRDIISKMQSHSDTSKFRVFQHLWLLAYIRV